MNATSRSLPWLTALVAAMLLAACGAKGPLFLPPPEERPAPPAPPAEPAVEPAPAVEPVPATDPGSAPDAA